MHYAVMAHVTDYDVWHEEQVSSDAVFAQFNSNIALAQRSVAEAVERAATVHFDCGCELALKVAFATSRDRISPEAAHRLKPIIGKYFPV